MATKIDIENVNETVNNINDKNTFDPNKKQPFKLDFNFDILNEPMPDFLQKKKKDNIFLNSNNYAYKRKYNEINNDEYSFPGGPTLKLK